MNRFSRIRHHVSVEDVKKKHLEGIAVENFIRAEEEISKTISEKFKRNWRKELREGMTTSNALSTVLPAEGEVAIDQVNPTDSASFADTNNMFGSGADNPAFVDTQIRASGSGTGSVDGFNVGGNYLAFQGGSGSSRMALLKPMDATKVDTLTITAIRGTGSNGGEHPDVVGTEELFVIYKTPDMSRSSYLSQDRNQNNIGAFPADAAIIAIDQGDGTLQNYSITIPEYARQKDVIFGLFQLGNSGSQYDHYGVTDIKFQRRTPINVVVPLDSPEAISFVRVGTNEGDPKKRKKKVNDQLAASDEYTSQQMGGEFPGQGTRIDGEDPFKSAEVQDVAAPSPLGKPAVTKSFADFQKGPEKVEVLKTPEQIEAQKTEYYSDLNNVIERGEYSFDDPLIAEIADKIIKLDPTSVDAYFYKSAYYDMTGEPEKGLKVLDQLIKNNPNSSDGYAVRSYYKEETGDYRGAISDIEKSIELNPDAEFVAYLEADLADLKFNLADLESDFAEKERLESEAGAIEKKAHQDYWDNADLIEPEEPVEYEYVNDKQLVRHLNFMDMDSLDPMAIPSLNRQAADWASGVEVIDPNPSGVSNIFSDLYTKAENWEGTPEEFAEYYANWSVTKWWTDNDPLMRQISYNNMIKKLNSGNNLSIGKVSLVFQQYKLSDIKNMAPDEVIDRFRRASREYYRYKEFYERDYKNASSKTNIYVINIPPRLHNLANYIKTLSENLPDYFFESRELEPVNNLYDQMKALYDEKDPEKEIKTELKELGFDKQYKDLMTAWDSKDKFSKFLTPFAALNKKAGTLFSNLFKGGVETSASVLGEQNMQIAIAKSVLLNRPVRVDPNTIDPELKFKLVKDLKADMFVDENFLEYQKALRESGDTSDISRYEYPQGSDSGLGLIPIVSEPRNYADSNIYEDDAGNVFTNDGTYENTTFQPFSYYRTSMFETAANNLMGTNPLASRGQAQYQIVVPPDGSEPYLRYTDHAYLNLKSDNPGEVANFVSQKSADFVHWLGDTAHKRSEGDPNTGGMAGYPPNIRGDLITKIDIPYRDLPAEVQNTIMRHPLVSKDPNLYQVMKDYIYTGKGQTKSVLKTLKDGSTFKQDQERAARVNKALDWIVDNVVETIMTPAERFTVDGVEGKEFIEKSDLRTATNMLQKYDEFIQQTVHTEVGSGYVPGYIDRNNNIQQRVDFTDQVSSTDQKHIKDLMFNREIEVSLENHMKNLKAAIDKGDEKLIKQLKEGFGTGENSTLNAHLNQISTGGKNYKVSLANSLGKGLKIDYDEFMKGRLVIKKTYRFRHDDKIRGLPNALAKIFDVSNDTTASGSNALETMVMSMITMTAAKSMIRPVFPPGVKSYAKALESAPEMPYMVQFDLPEKFMKILQGIEDTPDDPRSGLAGLDEPIIFDKDKKNNKKNNVKESTLFERVKSKQFFNPKDIKPTFPENPPPEIDKKTGMHPNYGKQAKRYNKLDPMSANAMPPTGDPEIDAVVDKQRTKKKPSERKLDYIKTVDKIKKMAKKS